MGARRIFWKGASAKEASLKERKAPNGEKGPPKTK